jgi:hypothetical protein
MSDNVRAMIDALQQNDMGAANKIFNDDIATRMAAAIDAEKVGVAAAVFGDPEEIESDTSDEEWEAASAEDTEDDEFELSDPEEDDYQATEEEPVEFDLEASEEE